MFDKKNSNKIKPIFYNRSLVIMGVLFAALALYGYCLIRASDATTPSTYVLFFSMCAAITGWLIGSYVNYNTSRKQHTINVLLQYTHSPIYKTYRDTFNKKYGKDGAAICQNDLEGCPEEMEAAKHLLNHYEFISAGLKSRDLDHNLLYNTIRAQLVELVNKCQIYVDDARVIDKQGNPQFPKYYEHVVDVAASWTIKH